ncbi:MAG: hypothetical protein ACI4VM_00530, partial [Anaerovoracaceae bacterium]
MNLKHMKKRLLSSVMAAVMTFSAVPCAFAAQQNSYHDPADHWMTSSNRTNELDANAVVTKETFNCAVCGKDTSFSVWRTPEYTRTGETAMSRNVRYSDGTLAGGNGTGTILDGTPGVDAYYTGYHWTKAVCETCGTMNSNMKLTDYSYGKNVYWLYDCAAEFREALEPEITYEYADSTYHKKTVTNGSYCGFCYGTNKETVTEMERHTLQVKVLPQIGHQRFAVVSYCPDCEYTETEYIAAKSVVASYAGPADGAAHTITVSDLSEAGVSAAIRYGTSADSCSLTTAPAYTEAGEYAVYYEITYQYKGETMTENGVAYVWLRPAAV